MSAVFGVMGRRGQAPGRDGFERALQALARYGPAGSAQWHADGIGLAYRYDAPPAAGRTPCFPRQAPSGGHAMTADLRLDGREQLCTALGLPGSARHHLTDADLLLRAYQRWEHDCVHHLLGAFSFAVWDASARTLFCARDHVGLRPFYYTASADRFAFATDPAALLTLDGCSDALDQPFVAAHLHFKFFAHPERTFYEDLRTLPPGHFLVVRPDGMRCGRYWHPEAAGEVRFAREEHYAEAFRALYAEAVRDRLAGATSVGVHLSGGLDSSSVAVMAARELRRQARPAPQAFTWNAPPDPARPPADEQARIEAVCAQEGLTCHYQTLTTEEIIAVLRWDLDRLPVTRVLLQEDALQRQAAARGVQVMLSGWGGDEGVSYNGRGYYASLLLSGRWRTLLHEGRTLPHPMRTFLWRRVLQPLWHDVRVQRASVARHAAAHYLHPDLLRQVRPLVAASHPPRSDPRSVQLHLLQYGWLTRRLESWTVNGARHGLVYRYPLLDRRLLEFALGLPPALYIRAGQGRWFFRHALQDVLPPEVAWNPGKQDPARMRHFGGLVRQALQEVGRELAARVTPFARAQYLDMPRLLADLQPASMPGLRGLGRRLHALQFLDL